MSFSFINVEFQESLAEVYDKLSTLEKQIWGKLIVMEGNSRLAKAYLRHPVVTIDGSDVEFDGIRSAEPHILRVFMLLFYVISQSPQNRSRPLRQPSSVDIGQTNIERTTTGDQGENRSGREHLGETDVLLPGLPEASTPESSR